MLLPVNAALLETCVLALLKSEDTYGYRITQTLTQSLGVSESALYPVLRRLQKDGALSTYDVEYSGRNRRYYRISPHGEELLTQYMTQWEEYKQSVDAVLHCETRQAEETAPQADAVQEENQSGGATNDAQ